MNDLNSGTRGACPSEESGAVYDADAVLAAEFIWLAQHAIGIVLPLAVHEQAVLILAGLERNGFFPEAAFELFQFKRGLLPIGKIARELNGLGVGGNQGKCDFLLGHSLR